MKWLKNRLIAVRGESCNTPFTFNAFFPKKVGKCTHQNKKMVHEVFPLHYTTVLDTDRAYSWLKYWFCYSTVTAQRKSEIVWGRDEAI